MADPIPRVVVVAGDQWLRAGLRAELRERGYDAVGAVDLLDATRYARAVAGRGPVGLVVADQDALGEDFDSQVLTYVRSRLGAPPMVLIAHGNRTAAEGDWSDVLRRPIDVGGIVDYVVRTMPNRHASAPLDA